MSLKIIKINKKYLLVKNNYNLFFLLNTKTNKYVQVNDFNVLKDYDLTSNELETIFNIMQDKTGLKDYLIEYDLPAYLEYIFTKKDIVKPTLPYRPNKGKVDFINTKLKLEEYYLIKVDKNNKNNKYYFNIENSSYTLLDEFQLGVLLEENFEFLLDDATAVPAVLTDNELHNLFMMFRCVEEPNPDCISFCNLTLNTNTFKEVDRVSTFTTKRIEHNYFENIENNTTTLVEKVLREIFVNKKTNDESLFYDFLQRLGASFLAFNKHKFMYMLTGNGNDGKSIVLSILRLVHGDLALSLKVRNLLDDFYLINLSDTNVLLLDELNKNSFSREVTAVLKDITGRGVIDSRMMYSQSTVKIQDYGVPFMATNIVPYVPFDDTAYWNRLHLVRLPNKFVTVEEEDDLGDNEYLKDEELEEKLAADTVGIEWLISKSIMEYRLCKGDFGVKQSALDTQFIYDGANPIRLFVERFVVEDKITSVLSVLEIKYYLLKFCMRNNISVEDLGVGSSRELSQEIGYKLKNKFKDVEKGRKEGVVTYKGLSLMVTDKDDLSIDELREEIKLFEDNILL